MYITFHWKNVEKQYHTLPLRNKEQKLMTVMHVLDLKSN